MNEQDPSQESEWYKVLAPMLGGAGKEILSSAISPSQRDYKQDARQVRKRALQSLLDRALKRQTAGYRLTQEEVDESRDRDSSMMQNAARGFVDSLLSIRGM